MARKREFFETCYDTEGKKRFVVVCGLLDEDSVWIDKEDTVKLEHGKPGSFLDATLKYKKKVFKRTLRIGYAICHENDSPNLGYGKALAKKRAVKDPLGVVETNNITMLQPEDVTALLKSKAKYIEDNLERFLKRRK